MCIHILAFISTVAHWHVVLSEEHSSRLVVTFQTAMENTFDGVDLGEAVVVKQYGRRLVLDLGAPFELDVEQTRFRNVLKSVQSVETDYLVDLQQTDMGQIIVNDALVATEVNSTDSNVDGAYISPATQTPLWNLMDSEPYSIHAEGVWHVTNSTPDVVVAVIDTGMADPARGLFLNLLDGYDFISDAGISIDGDGRDPDATDPGDWGEGCPTPSWHGTKVASILAARHDNELGMKGVAHNCSVLPVRVLGLCRMGYATDVTDAIVWAAGGVINGVPTNSNPAKVVSLSLAGQGACPGYLQSAINQATSLGALVIAAAGNSNGNVSSYFPANCDGVIAVAASTRDGKLAGYSNWGEVIAMSAPGGDAIHAIMSLGLNTLENGLEVAFGMGTSFAVPHVAGVAAIYYSTRSLNSPFAGALPISLHWTGFSFSRFNTNSSQCMSKKLCGDGIISVNGLSEHSTDTSFHNLSISFNASRNSSNHSDSNRVGDAYVSCSPGQYSTDGAICTTCPVGSYRTNQITPVWAPVQFTANTLWSSSWIAGYCANGKDCITPGACTYNLGATSMFLNQPVYNCPVPCTQYCGGITAFDQWMFWTVNQGWVINPEIYDITVVSSYKYFYKPDTSISSFIYDVSGGIEPVRLLLQYLSNIKYCFTCGTCSDGNFRSGCGESSAGSCAACGTCMAGKYRSGCSGLSSGSCISCTTGSYSDTERYGLCTSCAAGKYSTVVGASTASVCTPCTAGSYSASVKTSACTSCVSGKYSTGVGFSMAISCIPCEAGMYASTVGATFSLTCASCLAGSYSLTGASVCTRCASGKYATGVLSSMAASCISCEAGMFSATVGATVSSTCTSCLVGSYSLTGASICTLCVLGKYSVTRNASSVFYCTSCAAGSYSTKTGATTCILCAAGKYSTVIGSSSSSTCVSCVSPNYCADGSTTQGSCPAGFYCNNSSSKITCPPGFYCPINSTSAKPCPAGSNGINAGLFYATDCIVCPPGTYSSHAGVSQCTRCESGKYIDTSNKTSCLQCNVNPVCNPSEYLLNCSSTSIAQCSKCDDEDKPLFSSWIWPDPGSFEFSCMWGCDVGFFRTTENVCQPCKTQSFCDNNQYITTCNSTVDGVCLNCPNNPPNSYYDVVSELVDVNDCSWKCNNGFIKNSDALTCVGCTPGTYAVDSPDACSPCSEGKYAPAEAASVCSDCTVNTYTPTFGASSCLQCPICTDAGYYVKGCAGTSSGVCSTCTNSID
jgi:hypothetical protein